MAAMILLCISSHPIAPEALPEAFKELAYLGIEHTFNIDFPPVEDLAEFQQSPEMFQEWIELGTVLPKKIVRRSLIEMEASCK